MRSNETAFTEQRAADGFLVGVQVVEHHSRRKIAFVTDLAPARHYHADAKSDPIAYLSIARTNDLRIDVAAAPNLHAGAYFDIVANNCTRPDHGIGIYQTTVPEFDFRPLLVLLVPVGDEVGLGSVSFVPAIISHIRSSCGKCSRPPNLRPVNVGCQTLTLRPVNVSPGVGVALMPVGISEFLSDANYRRCRQPGTSSRFFHADHVGQSADTFSGGSSRLSSIRKRLPCHVRRLDASQLPA